MDNPNQVQIGDTTLTAPAGMGITQVPAPYTIAQILEAYDKGLLSQEDGQFYLTHLKAWVTPVRFFTEPKNG